MGKITPPNYEPEVLAPTGDLKRREPWLDIAKGVSIASVVLFHAGAVVSPETPAGKIWTLIDIGLFTFIMPLFFLVSGLFMGRSLALPMGEFLKARVWPMAYLFLLWAVLFAVLDAASGGTIGEPILASLSLQTILWYLAALAIHMVLSKLLVPFPTPAVITGAAALALPFAIWFPFEGWGITHTPHFFVFFLIGCRARARVFATLSRSRWIHVAGLISAGAALGAVAKLVSEAADFVYALMPLIAVPLVLIVSRWATRSRAVAAPLSALGRNTLPVFLIHPLALNGLMWARARLPLDGSPIAWVLPILITVATIAACLLIWAALRRVPGLFHAPTLKV